MGKPYHQQDGEPHGEAHHGQPAIPNFRLGGEPSFPSVEFRLGDQFRLAVCLAVIQLTLFQSVFQSVAREAMLRKSERHLNGFFQLMGVS